ncbi:hypothetical protein [Embleya sp. NPDC050493]|uniref:hypothetical protein n=1 Tax=Embleya sp. NPDC050493 TaxID=3363989 RepID=UPI00379A84C7
MSESFATLFCVVLIVFALSALIAYAVRRLSAAAPGRLVAVIAAITAFAGVVPAVIYAALAGSPASSSGSPVAPTQAVSPRMVSPVSESPATGVRASAPGDVPAVP